MLVLFGLLDQNFEGNLKEIGQIVPDSTRISFRLQQETHLLLSIIWPTSKLLVQDAR